MSGPRSTTTPTLEHVAEIAGVSTATISRAINTPDRVAPATRAKVRAAIAAVGYVPNLLAQGLASSRSRLVAALVPSIGASLFNETIEAMAEELGAAGYLVVLGLARGGPAEMDAAITSLLARRPDGLILTSAERSRRVRKRLREAGVTVIETWDLPARPIDLAIGFSHEAAGRALAEFVIAKGRRRPLVVTSNLPRATARLEAFRAVFRERGLPAPACDVRTADSFSINGRERLAAHLDAGGQADVVVCSSDLVALGVISEAHRRGLKAPDDLAVIGFGASEAGAAAWPALTTVRVDGAAIGRQAAEALIARARGGEPETRRIDVGFEIVARESA
jgi:LacI family gluconate utilization system Gnt-I transcriptional repressor